MRALNELSEAAAGQPMPGGMQLPAEVAEALAEAGLSGTALSPEMLEQLADAMEGRAGDLEALLDALAKAGLGEALTEGLGEGAGQGATAAQIDPGELLDFLEGEGKCDAAAVLQACRSMRAGRGGISRGPGHAEMVWSDPSSKEGVAFTPELLPPAEVRDARQARLMGVSRGDPEAEPGTAGSTGGALNHAAIGAGSAAGSVVLPRHREAVQRYFDRAAESSPSR